MLRFVFALRFLLMAAALSGGTAGAATVLDLAHDLHDGEQIWLENLVKRFNSSQHDVDLRLVERSPATKATALALLDRATAAAAGGEKAFRPLHQVMREARQSLDAQTLAPEAAAVVGDARGRALALPIARSTPVLHYNKAAFRAAGLDPENAPVTWLDVQKAADRLFDAGSTCPFTVSQPSEILIEQTSLWHGEPVFGRSAQPLFNGMLQIKHIALMASWFKSRFFVVFGRENAADGHFASGECAMIISGSHRYPAFKGAGIDVGVARLPVHDGYYGAPKNTVADGPALWVGQRRSKAEYRAAARFVRFLMTAETQTELAVAGGFLPFASAGRSAVEGALLAADSPQQAIALAQIKGSRGGAQLPGRPRVRRVLDEELEAVWDNRKPAKEALDNAVARVGAMSVSLATDAR